MMILVIQNGLNTVTNLCISEADVRTPRHSNRTAPVIATTRRNLVLVMKCHIALVGGSLALVAFQLMPPLGRSIVRVE